MVTLCKVLPPNRDFLKALAKIAQRNDIALDAEANHGLALIWRKGDGVSVNLTCNARDDSFDWRLTKASSPADSAAFPYALEEGAETDVGEYMAKLSVGTGNSAFSAIQRTNHRDFEVLQRFEVLNRSKHVELSWVYQTISEPTPGTPEYLLIEWKRLVERVKRLRRFVADKGPRFVILKEISLVDEALHSLARFPELQEFRRFDTPPFFDLDEYAQEFRTFLPEHMQHLVDDPDSINRWFLVEQLSVSCKALTSVVFDPKISVCSARPAEFRPRRTNAFVYELIGRVPKFLMENTKGEEITRQITGKAVLHLNEFVREHRLSVRAQAIGLEAQKAEPLLGQVDSLFARFQALNCPRAMIVRAKI